MIDLWITARRYIFLVSLAGNVQTKLDTKRVVPVLFAAGPGNGPTGILFPGNYRCLRRRVYNQHQPSGYCLAELLD